mgnify:CR=1 FL=1
MTFKDLIKALADLEPSDTPAAAEAISDIDNLPQGLDFPTQLLDVWSAFERLKDIDNSKENITLDKQAQEDLSLDVGSKQKLNIPS